MAFLNGDGRPDDRRILFLADGPHRFFTHLNHFRRFDQINPGGVLNEGPNLLGIPEQVEFNVFKTVPGPFHPFHYNGWGVVSAHGINCNLHNSSLLIKVCF